MRLSGQGLEACPATVGRWGRGCRPLPLPLVSPPARRHRQEGNLLDPCRRWYRFFRLWPGFIKKRHINPVRKGRKTHRFLFWRLEGTNNAYHMQVDFCAYVGRLCPIPEESCSLHRVVTSECKLSIFCTSKHLVFTTTAAVGTHLALVEPARKKNMPPPQARSRAGVIERLAPSATNSCSMHALTTTITLLQARRCSLHSRDGRNGA